MKNFFKPSFFKINEQNIEFQTLFKKMFLEYIPNGYELT